MLAIAGPSFAFGSNQQYIYFETDSYPCFPLLNTKVPAISLTPPILQLNKYYTFSYLIKRKS